MNNQLSIIVPVYNGEQSLEELCHSIEQSIKSYSDLYEIILIDDYSQDNSWHVIEEICANKTTVKGIKLAKNFGQQNAVFCGLSYAKYDYIITMDDDLQHNPKYIKNLLDKLHSGYDVVYGFGKQLYIHKYRKIGSILTNMTFNALLNKPKNINISSFRVMRKNIAKEIVKQSKNYVYISAQTFKLTNNVASVEIESFQRKYGDSNYTFKKLIAIFMKILVYYSKNPVFKFFQKPTDIFIVEKEINY